MDESGKTYPPQALPVQFQTAQNYPAQSYPAQNYPAPSYPAQNYPAQSYPAQNYPAPSYPAQNYPAQNYPAQNYPAQNYPAQNYPAQNYPAQHYPSAPPQHLNVLNIPPDQGCMANRRNQPQSQAVGAAGLIFISGGMNIAFSVGIRYMVGLSVHVRICWFIGAIIGAIISGFLANRVSKKYILQFSSILVTIGGIVLACTYHKVPAITAALYLDGIANGLIFAPTLALIGEISVCQKRGGLAIGIEQLCYGAGIVLQTIFGTIWWWYRDTGFSSLQSHGILSAVFGGIALIFASIFTIESPVIMLANGEEQAAIHALRRLQRPSILTTDTYQQLDEHKRYLALNKDLTVGESISEAIPAFVRLVTLRALNAMSLTKFVVDAMLMVTILRFKKAVWPYAVFGVGRFFGQIVAVFCVDSVGRKKLLLGGLLLASGMAFGLGSQFSYEGLLLYQYNSVDVVLALLIVFQAFAGLAFAPTSAYLSEGFPLGIKQHCIGFTFIMEMLVYVIICVCDWSISGTRAYFFVVGAFYFLSFVAGIWSFPETKLTPLRVAQDKFRSFFAPGFQP
ncbi:solute carrier family 2, facilitated glucose transporter member 5-like [Scaptodrosophila lebanonensis]|uniref:Solute carrier family 2, facilitated glucose transporter member 5-like n=1 Tax=Drosophila lebanonensis TaxID=7225 RepID=A0A6J2TCD4_DROLE|nr:solute carrier family 2, facilitated glucose transporter member 5-like [Scaptodrosophila lebanonensis]